MYRKICQLTTIFISCCVLLTAQAQNFDLDIINLQHRGAEEVIPMIEPFLIPEAVVTARGYKLIIKSTPENLTQIREIIKEIDQQLRQLNITVSIGNFTEEAENKTQAEIMAEVKDDGNKIQITTGDDSVSGSTGAIVRAEKKTDEAKVTAKVKTRKTTTKRDKPVMQTIRSTEGQWATINTGQSIPVVERTRNPDGTVTQTIHYRGATSGFKVLPRLQPDNRVLLLIRPHQTSVSRQGGGRFDIQSMETTVAGELGEWIPLGGMHELTTGSTSSTVTSTRSRNVRSDSVFVKIDIVQ